MTQTSDDLRFLMENLPKRMRAERQALGLSQRTAAEQIGMAYGRYCEIEGGYGVAKSMNVSTLIKITTWLES